MDTSDATVQKIVETIPIEVSKNNKQTPIGMDKYSPHGQNMDLYLNQWEISRILKWRYVSTI